MMGAVQPFISGAISKTANMPESATVDDVAKLYLDSWKMGVKALAIYRDNCKVAQPHGRQAGRARAQADAQGHADRAHGDRPQVPGRRVRGLHPRRAVPRRHPGRRVRRHRQGGHDARRAHERAHDLGLARPPVRRAARRLRLEVQPHALRAVRPHERSRHPRRQVARRLHLPVARQEVPRRRDAGRASASCPPRCARVCRASRPRPSRSRDGTIVRRPSSPRPRRPRVADAAGPDAGQRALFNAWEDAQECAKCGGRKVRTGSCYTCRDCGDNSGCG